MLRKIKSKLKGPATEKMYKFLMREASEVPGRQLFGVDELKLVNEALVSQNLFGVDGKMVTNFEKEFASAYGVPYAVASTSGTAAIHTALGALELNPGDEVITAPITDMGTIIPILYQNAIPIFADIDETYNMDPADVEKKITPRTKAILVVHLFANPCDMDKMVDVAKRHNIPLIEDCAQAHMTDYKGKFVGTIGDIGCFSFQQSKHMTTGDGGMTITSNKTYADKMKLFVDKNYARKGWGARAYVSLAPNYRMNELTAAVGRAQLKKVKNVIRKRHELGEYLTKLLTGYPEIVPAPVTEGGSHGYWQYPLTLKGIDVNAFVQEAKKVDVWGSPGYTVKPIYLCTEALTNRKTYGTSGCPFTCKYTEKNYEYKEGLCPRAEEALKHIVCLYPDESWNMKRIEKCAQGIIATVQKLKGENKAAVTETKPVNAPVKAKAVDAKTIKIGVIGCGQMGDWHFSAYRNNPHVQMTAFVDTDISKTEPFARKVGGRAYSTVQEMLKNEKLDGVSICTIPSTHKGIVLDLLNAGVNVLCEKPLAISTQEAQEMTGKAREKGLLLLTAFKFRFFEEVLKAKELLDKGSIGKILNFRIMFGGYMNMAGTWYAKKEIAGGGIIIDTAPHAIDLVHYLFGKISSVSAQTAQIQKLEVEDTATLNVVLENGAAGTIEVSWSVSVPAKTYLEVYGEDGAILLDLGGLSQKFKTWDEWQKVPNQTTVKDAFKRQIDHFVKAIADKKPGIITNEAGLAAQQVVDAAYRSAAHGNAPEKISY